MTGGGFVDAMFAISCRSLPVDHAYALAEAVWEALPWLREEPLAGVHLANVGTSGAGWVAPDRPDAELQLSHRARLALRLPSARVEQARALVGRTLTVAGQAMRVDALTPRPLLPARTLFSRAVALACGADEASFLERAGGELEALGLPPPRMLCGRATTIATPQRSYEARSLMLAGLAPGESVAVQEAGLGPERRLGCGLFVPCKDIGDLRSRDD